jgi:transposase
VANVAMAHGVNANIVHGWRKLARRSAATDAPVRFVPVTVAPVALGPVDERSIEVELRRGGITIKLSWPMSASMDLSAWMRELLR